MIAQHEMQFRVRYSETDALGLLHHANYLNYFEQGRMELYRAQGGTYRELEEQGVFIVVIRLHCRYLRVNEHEITLRGLLCKDCANDSVTTAKIQNPVGIPDLNRVNQNPRARIQPVP